MLVADQQIVVEAHRRRIWGLCYRLTGDRTAADDLAQESIARAIERADVAALEGLLAEEVWGIVDDGAGRRRPSVGIRAVARQWQNALRRYGQPGRVGVVPLNGEPAVMIAFAGEPFATVHPETGGGRILSIRVLRDAPRLGHLRDLVAS